MTAFLVVEEDLVDMGAPFKDPCNPRLHQKRDLCSGKGLPNPGDGGRGHHRVPDPVHTPDQNTVDLSRIKHLSLDDLHSFYM